MGTPQGAPISPLLSNIYMRRFVKGWKTGGHEKRLAARIVNYADDFVICCKGTADCPRPGFRPPFRINFRQQQLGFPHSCQP